MENTEITLKKSDTIHKLEINDKEIIIIATAHVSKESKEEVKRVIEEEKPDSVCIELDENRYKSITEKDKQSNMNIVQVIKDGKTMLVLANLFLSSFQKKIAAKLNIQPGAEMIQGIESANEIDAKLVLADRDIQTTFKRIWRNATAGEKFKLLYQILGSVLVSEKDLEISDIEKMKTADMLDSALSVMGKTFPLVKEVLIDERDIYLANKIKNAEGKKIVAVLGAGHVPGVKKRIMEEAHSIPDTIPEKKFEKRLKKMTDESKKLLQGFYKKGENETNYKLNSDITLDEEQKVLNVLYNELPKKGIGGKVFGWLIPIAILVWIISGFFLGGFEGGLKNFISYALGTGIGALLGSLVAFAHPITMLVGLISAPITVLHPLLGVGWFTGLSEAFFRKPLVSDLENLGRDIQTFKGFFKNRFTHILLVILLSSFGTMFGIFVGIPLFDKLLSVTPSKVNTESIIKSIDEGNEIIYNDITISGKLYFNNKTIKDKISFVNCIFKESILIDTVIFENEVSFIGCTMEKDVKLENVEFYKNVNFSNTIFKNESSFAYSKFTDYADFSGVIFLKKAPDLEKTIFISEYNFSGVKLGEEPFAPNF